MKLKITNSEVQESLSGKSFTYPKYCTQILNLANQNAQATRPRVVGQMSDLIQEFGNGSLSDWRKWYLADHANALDIATERVFDMVENFKENISKIDKPMIKKWIEELVIVKTYAGLKFQDAILKKIAEMKNKSYRLADPFEESQGIDGFIGDIPVSIKPISYKLMQELREEINVSMIYYEKNKSGITAEYEF